LAGLLLSSCDSETTGVVDADGGAMDSAVEPVVDAPADQASGAEPPPDAMADSSVDAPVPDVAADQAADAAPDVAPDVGPDVAPDVPPPDAPLPDLPPDMAAADMAPDMSADGPPPECTPVPGTPSLVLEPMGGGFSFSDPVDIQSPPDDPRLFIVEQGGTIRVIEADGITVRATPFLDISGNVTTGGERGLLGLAFHPDYDVNGRFFVHYSASPSGDTQISEFSVSADPNVADALSESSVLSVTQPATNHNGGAIAFGPGDGYLYIALGDGGSSCDGAPGGPHGQSLDTLLGKILRIDVDGGAPYAVPATNPFFGGPELEEIWAYGLRNPWRISFDRETFDLYIGDVGQDAWEEIDVQPASSTGGENYGWADYEGSVCQDGSGTSCGGSTCPGGTTFPVHEYPHELSTNCFGVAGSVTGGYVYRGCRMPGYHGTYFYADYCLGTVHSFEYAGGLATNLTDWPSLDATVATFGQDRLGELYLADLGSGVVYRIAPQ